MLCVCLCEGLSAPRPGSWIEGANLPRRKARSGAGKEDLGFVSRALEGFG